MKFGAIQVLCNAMGGGGGVHKSVHFSITKAKGLQSNVISVTRGWVFSPNFLIKSVT